MNHKQFGNEGEQAAVDYLVKSGYSIIDTNIRPLEGMRRGELDIIAWEGDVLCFIEVKTRVSRYFNASDAITVTKRKQLTLLAQAYINKYRLHDSECRFDVICVYSSHQDLPTTFEMLKGAFDPVY